jgi:hypothetical protein
VTNIKPNYTIGWSLVGGQPYVREFHVKVSPLNGHGKAIILPKMTRTTNERYNVTVTVNSLSGGIRYKATVTPISMHDGKKMEGESSEQLFLA